MRTYILSAILSVALSGCAFAANSDGTRPDPILTPGAVRTTDKNDICTTKTSTVRNVPDTLKEQVRRRYGMTSKRDLWCNTEEACEVDHLIPLTAGGSNDIENLWPQTFNREIPWNAHVKDKLEARVRKLICKQGIPPEVIQKEIATDWVAAYKKYIGNEPVEGESAE